MSDDWKPLWDTRRAALESAIGRADGQVRMPVGEPFHLGGSAEVLTFRNHAGGVAYATASLIGSDISKPNRFGQYELMICVRQDTKWAPSLISWLARYTVEAVLEPGQTMDIGPVLPQPTQLSNFLFVHYADITVEHKQCNVLLCLGITPDEMKYLQEHGASALITKLKDSGVYPFTDLERSSVVP